MFIYEVIVSHNGRRAGDVFESDRDVFNPYLIRLQADGNVAVAMENPDDSGDLLSASGNVVRRGRPRKKVTDVQDGDLSDRDPQDREEES